MALGKIKADTLEHSTAGSLDTSYVVNGSAKAFCTIQLNDTILESLNTTSFTDNGTGDITHTLVAAMSNINHITTAFNIRQHNGGTAWCGGYGSSSYTSSTSTTARMTHLNASNQLEDQGRAMMLTHGDLA